MVDILAKQRPHTQTELDSKLTPIGQKLRESSLISKPGIVKDYMLTELPLIQDERIAVKTKAQSQTQASAKEGLVERPESNDVAEIENVSTVQEGEVKPSLVDRPVMYAAEGLNDVEVDRPIVVGEKEREVIFPSKNGISIVPVSSLVENPNEKKASPIDDEAFINYMKTVENAPLLAGDKSKLQHNSAEGGNDTVAFGHKLTDEEVISGKVYGYDYTNLSTDQANDIFKSDIKKAHTTLIDKFGDQYIGLDNKRKQMLIDFQYNLGGLNKFPKFTEALFKNDTETMMKEYKRFFKDPKSGDMKPLGRNKNFSDFFFDAKESELKSEIKIDPASAQQSDLLFRNPTTSDKQSETEQLLNYIFPKEEVKEVKNDNGRAMPSGPPSKKTDQEPEGFDFNKLTYGKKGMIDINYFYDNLDAIATHGFKQRFGQDLDPNAKQLKDARDEAMAKLSAYIAIKIDKVDGKILDTKREEYIKPDPYDPLGKRKQELFDEYGPKILPEA